MRAQITDKKTTDWLTQATAAVAEACPGQDFEHWPLCRQLLPHWLRIVEQAEAVAYQSVELSSVCNQAGGFLDSQGRYEAAESLHVQALDICKTELGDRHPDTAQSLNNLAGLYEAQRQYEAAEPLYVIKALDIRKTELGDRHPYTAASLFNLAALYHQNQRSQQALSYIQQALAIYNPVLGHDHPTTQAANRLIQNIEQALAKD